MKTSDIIDIAKKIAIESDKNFMEIKEDILTELKLKLEVRRGCVYLWKMIDYINSNNLEKRAMKIINEYKGKLK